MNTRDIRFQRRLKRGGGRRAVSNPPTGEDRSVVELLELLAVDKQTPSRSAMRR